MAEQDHWDCIIVGAGPAGLSAALYMARFRRRVLVLHDGKARAARIPKTHNAPGYDSGIAGTQLLERMTRHCMDHGARMREAHVAAIAHDDDRFTLTADDGREWTASTVILATGLCLNQIDIPHEVHEQAIADNVLRYCPICDGYEHIDKALAVVGCDEQGAAEALFLRQYTRDITLLPRAYAELDPDDIDRLEAANVRVIQSPIADYLPRQDSFDIAVEGPEGVLSFDVVYPALGMVPRTELAEKIGLKLDDGGRVSTDSPHGTAIPGLYCAGDIVEGLAQISVAMGHGAIAATKAHNWLRDQEGHTFDTLEAAE